ncbi:hypothetical protein Bhyg_14663 [Pseudolycoriella hygida]|uniref:Uncharacterized protein n=1 Tax=Pseudolycoriella hygida TaxID=35572 RepID=A0A9Q0MQI5_9DIPT|nr:hypothetical protein Bhyg_14663 [Pseudolycoriella hygida]
MTLPSYDERYTCYDGLTKSIKSTAVKCESDKKAAFETSFEDNFTSEKLPDLKELEDYSQYKRVVIIRLFIFEKDKVEFRLERSEQIADTWKSQFFLPFVIFGVFTAINIDNIPVWFRIVHQVLEEDDNYSAIPAESMSDSDLSEISEITDFEFLLR